MPLLGRRVVLEGSLAFSERGGVVVATAILYHGGHVVMEHLVEDDGFDEVAWDPGLIEHWVNPDQLLLGEVRPELQRALAPLRLNPLPPGDACVEGLTEVPTREVVEDGTQVVVLALGSKLGLGLALCDETRSVRLDEAVERRRRHRPASAQVVGDRREDVLVDREEHVMKTHLQSPAFRLRREHRAPVVSNDETDPLPETVRELATPFRGPGVRAVEIVFGARWGGLVDDPRQFACELKGKLQHLPFG